MACKVIFVFLTCFVLMTVGEKPHDSKDAAPIAGDHVQLLQTKSKVEGAEFATSENRMEEDDDEEDEDEDEDEEPGEDEGEEGEDEEEEDGLEEGEEGDEVEVEGPTLKLIMAEIEAQTRSDQKGPVRLYGLVWAEFKAIPGKTVAYTWKNKTYQIPVSESMCKSLYAKNNKCSSSCTCTEVAPLAKEACVGKQDGEKCEIIYGDANKVKMHSICSDMDHDGTSVCLPYKMAPCYKYNFKIRKSIFYPVGTYCTTNSGNSWNSYDVRTKTSSKGSLWTYTIGTCQTNTGWDKKDKPVKCLGKIE